MIYLSLDDFEERFPLVHYCNSPNLRIFLVAEREEDRTEACARTKSLLEEMLRRDIGESEKYEVQVVDLAVETDSQYTDDISPFWDRIGDNDVGFFVPIFHNADDHPELPQWAFDRDKPAVFSVTQQGYIDVLNTSKRNTYTLVRAD